MRWIRFAALILCLTSCGGDNPSSSSSWSQLAAKCATPRTGIDPATNQPYPDRAGTLDDEKKFLRAWTDDLYLWYREVPAVDPAPYTSSTDYFAVLKTTAKTASGADKDRFHFWDTTAHWTALSQSGVEAGYGVTWVILARTPPREVVAAYNEPGSPAADPANNVNRGAHVLTVDGADLVNGSDQATVDKLNAGLFPATAGETHTFTILDNGSTTSRTVTMQSKNVTSVPVQNVHSIPTATGKVGYMLFNDHLATAEGALVNAVNQLKADAISDLVLDIRYNGGGYLAIASELAYMIGGANTTGKTFERLTFNDKHPDTDPVTGRPLAPTPFYNQSLGFSLASGLPLPTLGLNRVFVLTGSGTCSASESILNGLAGVDVQPIQIGSTTCGKPYGFYPQDNCGITYFSIQFKGVNAKGFGDYADGFTPGATTPGGLPGCAVADDFGHALGDAAEARLAAALAYRASPTCPAPSASSALSYSQLRGEGEVIKSIWRQNRIVQR
jgi:carboxyl-terminal processing protease